MGHQLLLLRSDDIVAETEQHPDNYRSTVPEDGHEMHGGIPAHAALCVSQPLADVCEGLLVDHLAQSSSSGHGCSQNVYKSILEVDRGRPVIHSHSI